MSAVKSGEQLSRFWMGIGAIGLPIIIILLIIQVPNEVFHNLPLILKVLFVVIMVGSIIGTLLCWVCGSTKWDYSR